MPEKRKTPLLESRHSLYSKRSRISYADDEEVAEDNQGANNNDQGGNGDYYYSKAPNTYERPRSDPTYGQRSAFPGLEDMVGDELPYGPAEDGIEYLRMVRLEANSLPTVFVAPKSSTDTPETPAYDVADASSRPLRAKTRSFYSDGVYIAGPSDAPVSSTLAEIEESQSDAQSSYYRLLHYRFLLLHKTLRCSPPPSAIAALDDLHPISLPRGSKAARSEWRRLLLAADPQMVQLACMDMESVLGILDLVGRLMSDSVRSSDGSRIRRIGGWAWGLLARCREVGELGSGEVGEIRDLGKRAVRILTKVRESDMTMDDIQDEQSDIEETETRKVDLDHVAKDENDPQPDSEHPGTSRDDLRPGEAAPLDAVISNLTEPEPELLQAAKARLQAALQLEQAEQCSEIMATEVSDGDRNPYNATEQARALLDMIITVVGGFYGQRDLLNSRDIWDDDKSNW